MTANNNLPAKTDISNNIPIELINRDQAIMVELPVASADAIAEDSLNLGDFSNILVCLLGVYLATNIVYINSDS